MKVLWITNVLLPEVKCKLGAVVEHKGTGSWVLALADALQLNNDVKLYIAVITTLVKKITEIQGERISYYAIPAKGDNSYHSFYEDAYREVVIKTQPDVVHIHGTEYPHSLAALRACGSDRTVVSLQGIVSAIAPFYMGGISTKEVRHNITLKSIIRPSLMKEQKKMMHRGQYEQQLFKECKFFIGRTSWDKAQIWSHNPNATYFHCDEALRKEFYSGRWSFDQCQSHSIFVSQGYYPLKGLHKLIDALGIVVLHYPDVTLRVAGIDFTYSNGSIIDQLRISSYGRIIKKKIIKNKLNKHVVFTGSLTAEEMKKEYLQANLFVCPSCIENSPNSLGEAQMLGVPCVASYVGGVMDMMRGNESNLYRFEETGMLASKICSIFELEGRVNTTNMCLKARERHDPVNVVNELYKIYNNIFIQQLK